LVASPRSSTPFFASLPVSCSHVTELAFIASGEMAVAYFQAHAPRGFWPIQNGGELAVLYCFLFLYIAARGSGLWGIQSGRKR
jgi:uncharacterized membrane protein YphA (DoxX/SURF4 family)